MLLDLSDTPHSDAFAQRARHPDAPGAFSRTRQLPLPALVASLLFMRASSQQVLLDSFFGRLCGDGSLVRAVSDRAFAQARARLHMPALSWLNEQLVARADAARLVPRWQGLRLGLVPAVAVAPGWVLGLVRVHGVGQAPDRSDATATSTELQVVVASC